MKKLTFLLILLFIYSHTFSQSFGEFGTKWYQTVNSTYPSGVPGQGYYTNTYRSFYEYVSDTIVGTDTVQLIKGCGWNTFQDPAFTNSKWEDTLYLYQESLKVYKSDTLDNFELIYDFNLVVGDSFPVPVVNTTTPNLTISTDTLFYEVIGIDSTLINGTFRKTIVFEDFDAYEPGMIWVEGVGDTVHGAFKSVIGLSPYLSYDMSCFVENNVNWLYYGNCMDYSCSSLLKIDNETESKGKISCYPNPFRDEVTIIYKENKSEYTITLLDLNGRVVYADKSEQSIKKVDLSTLKSGVYIVLISDDQNTQRMRIVKE